MAMIEDLKVVTMDLSLRDLFAGQAIGSVLLSDLRSDGPYQPIAWAKIAYEIADAMLAARNKKGE